MKKIIGLYIVSLLFIACKPTIEHVYTKESISIDKFPSYNPYSYYWHKNEEQVKYYSNGLKEVEYINKNGSKIRRTYNENGSLETEIEVSQIYRTDTFWQINAVTLEDEEVIIRGIADDYLGLYHKFIPFDFEAYYWKDSLIENQVSYWDNDLIKTKYGLKNNKRIRKDFDNEGNLLREAEVKQSFSIDTTWQIDPETLEDEMTIESGYIDSFIKITFLSESYVSVSGNYELNKKSGNWYSFDGNNVKEVYYQNGKLTNIYNLYTSNGDYNLHLKWKGFFKTIISKERHEYYNNDKVKEYYTISRKRYIKDSLWERYGNAEILTGLTYYHTDTIK